MKELVFYLKAIFEALNGIGLTYTAAGYGA